MKFSLYFNASLAATIAIIVHAVYTREQFYPIVLFLVTSKLSFVVLGNMAVAAVLLIWRISKSVFLGMLREVEIEQLVERAKYTITETCLALTVFRNELSPPILALFGVLLFLKAFHWLSKLRIDYLEQVVPVSTSTHIRLMSLIILLSLCDTWVAYSCIQYTLKNGRSVLILFGFEFGLLVISAFNLICRYILHLIDSRLANGLKSKGLYVMLVDLICDALRFVTYVFFFSLVFVYYGLPLHIIREVWMAFHTFQTKLSSFIRYIQLTNNLDKRLDNATTEEMAESGDCLICREGMETGKKLPCGHVFHLDCLRMWLQHQQSCPLCRAEIPVTASAFNAARDAALSREAANAVDGGNVPVIAEENAAG
jgi:E3 ubiquitin-protein ligase synoviolin